MTTLLQSNWIHFNLYILPGLGFAARFLCATGKRIRSIFSQYKFHLSAHVLVVNGFHFFEVNTATHLEWFFIVSRATKLIQNIFLAQNPVHKAGRCFNVVVFHQHGASPEFYVPHFCGSCVSETMEAVSESIDIQHIMNPNNNWIDLFFLVNIIIHLRFLLRLKWKYWFCCEMSVLVQL